jgi:hypothetical protein
LRRYGFIRKLSIFFFFEKFAYFVRVNEPARPVVVRTMSNNAGGGRRPRRAGARCELEQSDEDKIGGNRRTVSMIGPAG